jgi:hypothetical protein
MNPNPYHPSQIDSALRQDPPVLPLLVGEDGGMSVDCLIELQDVTAFAIYHNTRSPLGRKQFLKRWLIMGLSMIIALVSFVYLVSVQGQLLNLVPVFVFSITFVVAYVGLYPWIYVRGLRKGTETIFHRGRNLALFGPRRLTLTPQFMVSSSPYTQSVARWIAVERIDHQPPALYLYLSSNTAFIVPRRAFASDDDFQTFVNTAQQFHARALAAENPLRTSP